ncbi:undecaprenyldiphospho-muramoylpentapeptide beta-N-acetylglucosaminyltransferase [Candidatus Peregrinibacteria bacterium]|nr:undecaprenyldiphospho-muramoylpentapeptide beta-N-acetylglucosaminyltransferase [Candidatus Peregrinibacteria bacterium]
MRVVFTGGGTLGHALPNIAIIEEVRRLKPDCEIFYIGSRSGPEKQICESAGISYKGIFAGKFRRYFSVSNFIDIFKFPIGLLQAVIILKKFRPSVVFSKGGFVAVPVVIAAKMRKIPVIIHEADAVPGLANKISSWFANKICVTFPESGSGFNAILTGMPVRKMIFEGDAEIGRKLMNIKNERPVILVMGGSLGAESINKALWNNLPCLLRHFNIIHITGRGKTGIKAIHDKLDNYRQIEYSDAELPHLYAMSSLVVSRAGASAIAEIAALKKPSLLIPLGTKASRGEQVENANYMKSIGASGVIYPNENLHEELAKRIIALISDKKNLAAMSAACRVFGELCKNAALKLAELILSA